MEAWDQEKLDHRMIELDGTPNKGRLGANAILSISEACIKAAAATNNQPLYKYIKESFKVGGDAYVLPQPTFNVINGGKHGNGKLEFQEFHVLPKKEQSFKHMLRVGDEVYLHLKKLLVEAGIFQGVGDEGGFTGEFLTNMDALDWMKKAIQAAGYKFAEDAFVGLDTAASEFYKDGAYHISDKSYPLSNKDLIEYLYELHTEYHFHFLEDGLDEADWDGWQQLTNRFANTNVPIIGDDLLTTNPARVQKAIDTKSCNAVLVKPNQIGSITETLDVVRKAKNAGWTTVLSHRSGETNDAFVADFAVGVSAEIVKFGCPARGERLAKYNRLVEIEEEL